MKHKCELDSLRFSSISECHEDEDGNLYAGNSIDSLKVNYCPFCGYKAKKLQQFKMVDSEEFL